MIAHFGRFVRPKGVAAAFMDDRADLLLIDLEETQGFGAHLSKPSNQLVRLVALFDAKQRISFVEDAHAVSEGRHAKSSLIQFATFYVLMEYVEELGSLVDSEAAKIWSVLEKANLKGSHVISLSRLPVHLWTRAANIAAGEDSQGIALILANTLLTYDMTRNEELARLITRTLEHSVLTAEQAAAVASVVEYTNQDILRFEWKAGCLLDDTRIFPDACFSDFAEKTTVMEAADLLAYTVKEYAGARQAILQEQRDLTAVEKLCDRFRLAQDCTGLFIPLRKHVLVAKSIAEAEKLAQDNRHLVLSMSAREFEEFMANIFRDLGFDVELTKTSRDGGVDLVCLRSLHGIPIRLAVELKRYKDKPINVSLVRSFVGANQQWHANKLIYVTTSSYTQSAYDFADNYASHILTLKDYGQITEWCKEIESHPNPLL